MPRWPWIALLLACLLGWWYSPLSPRVPPAPQLAPTVAGLATGCPMPPRVNRGEAPLQTPVPEGMGAFELQVARLQPLHGFSVEARVLSRQDYLLGREAKLSPTDLALGWGRMREDAVLSRLDIGQSGRWYHYRWSDPEPPLPPNEIRDSSANMHLIPADDHTARALHAVRKGQTVRIDGWLVEANSPDGWRWRSSTSRQDTGQGACEVIYVCSISAW